MENISTLIIDALKETESEVFSNADLDTEIFGGKGTLDSLGLVTFLINLEQKIEDEFGKNITIADEKAMSAKNSPFRTVTTLELFLINKLNEHE